uniref:Uncharacterized protein n=1 Tax=Haptolina brevifila TaxID=156173 RepID=A0A7S2FQQ3_9EUKA
MSTTVDRGVAAAYASAPGKPGLVFELSQGMVDRGADISFLSYYPHEREVLFAPLCGLEVRGSRVTGTTAVLDVALSINLASLTIEQMVSKRRKMVTEMCNNMLLDLTLETRGKRWAELKSVLNGSDMSESALQLMRRQIHALGIHPAEFYNFDAQLLSAIRVAVDTRRSLSAWPETILSKSGFETQSETALVSFQAQLSGRAHFFERAPISLEDESKAARSWLLLEKVALEQAHESHAVEIAACRMSMEVRALLSRAEAAHAAIVAAWDAGDEYEAYLSRQQAPWKTHAEASDRLGPLGKYMEDVDKVLVQVQEGSAAVPDGARQLILARDVQLALCRSWLSTTKAELDKEVENALPWLGEAATALKHLRLSDFTALKQHLSEGEADVHVLAVCKVLVILLNQLERTPTLGDVMEAFSNPKNVLDRLLTFDKDGLAFKFVPRELARGLLRAQPALKAETVNETLQPISAAAAAFYLWASAMLMYFDMANVTSRKRDSFKRANDVLEACEKGLAALNQRHQGGADEKHRLPVAWALRERILALQQIGPQLADLVQERATIGAAAPPTDSIRSKVAALQKTKGLSEPEKRFIHTVIGVD